MKTLAIETSCDETSVAVIQKNDNNINISSNIVLSQIDIHREWGGVVPNIAGREHAENIIPTLDKALKESKCKLTDIDFLSVTDGPGLMPALLVGVSLAKAISFKYNKPLLGIHHIEGHIYANWISKNKPKFPVLSLVVSGGHTQLILMKSHFEYEILGQTLDDAVGESFDKVARLLGLSYPGGPEISKMSDKYKNVDNFNIKLPRPMIKSGDYNFSFSGIKTAVLYVVRDYQKNILKLDSKRNLSKENKVKLPEEFVVSVSHEFQEAVCEVLVSKTISALKNNKVKSVVLAGGVSANKLLREKLKKEVFEVNDKIDVFVPDIEYCVDNAAMIGVAGLYRFEQAKDKQRAFFEKGYRNVLANPTKKIVNN